MQAATAVTHVSTNHSIQTPSAELRVGVEVDQVVKTFASAQKYANLICFSPRILI